MVITITDKNRSLFERLASTDMLIQQPQKGHYCLGCIGEDEEGQYPAGVLSFTVQPDESGDVEAVIDWLYVAKRYRFLGAAGEMLAELAGILERTGVENVRCDVPFSEEYNEICVFLERRGFTFYLEERYELSVTMSDLLDIPLLNKKMGMEKICPLEKLTETEFHRELLTVLMERDKKNPGSMQEFMLRETTVRKEHYEQSVSCAVMEQEEASAFFLVRCYPSGMLEPVLLAGAGTCTGLDILSMLCYAFQKAKSRYDLDTPVYIRCRSEDTAGLIAYLFPDIEPRLVRTGHCETNELLRAASERRD